MATKLLVCPECASEVAPGRFACTSCGALLAFVASAPRSLGWTEAITPPPVNPASPATDRAVTDAVVRETSESNGFGDTIGPAWAHGPLERAPGETDLDLTPDEATSAIDAHPPGVEPSAIAGSTVDAIPTASAQPGTETAAPLDADPVAQVEPDQTIQFDGDAEVARDDAPLALAAAATAATTDVTAAEPASIVEPPASALGTVVAGSTLMEPANEPSWPETRGWPPPGAPQPAPEPAPPPRAGAYLPPSAVLTTVGDPLARASANAPGNAASLPVAGAPVASTVSGAPGAASRSRRMPDIDRSFPPQAVLVGAAIATLGFLLPWAPIVIGSAHYGDYFDQWGLATPGNAAILLVIIALGAAASQVDRLPGWARPGLPAVILSGILIGLVWPYLFARSLQPSIGVYLTLAAAIVLVVGGLLDLWVSRHAGGSRPV